MRQPDPRYRQLLTNLRDLNSVTDDDYALLQSRILDNLEPEQRVLFRDAPVITARNIIRHQVGMRTLYGQAKAQRQRVLLLFAEDRPLVPVLHAIPHKTTEQILALPENSTNHLLGALILVIGEDYVHNTTVKTVAPLGAVNNAKATLTGLVPDPREPDIDLTDVAKPYVFRFMPLALILRLATPALPFCFPGLQDNEYACTPQALQVQLPMDATAKPKLLPVQRTMFPLAPANSMTGHRAQGCTVERMIGDLAAPRQGHAPAFVYTMLSRCKTLDGLAILRNFSRADLRSNPNIKLAADQARLDRLQAQLLARYRNDDPVDRIDLRVCFPPGYRLPIRAGTAATLIRGPSLHLNALQSLQEQVQADAVD